MMLLISKLSMIQKIPVTGYITPEFFGKAERVKLSKLSSHLQEAEDHLPIDPKYRNPKVGSLAPIRPEIEKALGKLQAVPVDIEPRFTTA
jgi:hypothetical protein